MSKTIQATVKVMLSYDYCHFEISKTIVNEITQESVFSAPGITQQEIDDARKDCQRLADKAVGQYRTAKDIATKRLGSSYERMQLEKEVRDIKQKKDEFVTPEDKAKIKALEDYNHYNYMDDEGYQL